MKFRPLAALAAAALVAGVLTACVGQPAPVESTPEFTSENDAFAAAEQTYRNYVDALNQVDLSDPATFEPVYAWTTGEANSGARKTFTQMHADGWVVGGETKLALVEPDGNWSADGSTLSLATCLDVTAVTLVNATGESVVSPDRRNLQSFLVTLERAATSPTRWLIGSIDGREGEPLCS